MKTQQTTSEPLPACAGNGCPDAACSAWVKTADKLPGQIGDQVDVLMWSPEWATWLKGMVTRWEDECEWSIYNQQDDRYHDWHYPPAFWMSPILPNALLTYGVGGEKTQPKE